MRSRGAIIVVLLALGAATPTTAAAPARVAASAVCSRDGQVAALPMWTRRTFTVAAGILPALRPVSTALMEAGLLRAIHADAPHRRGAPLHVPADFAAALAATGVRTTPLADTTVDQVGVYGVGPDEALAIARAAFPLPASEPPHVYLTGVTTQGLGPRTDVPMYIVQLTGVDVMSAGGGATIGDATPVPIPDNHELVVFVDALCGSVAFASSFR